MAVPELATHTTDPRMFARILRSALHAQEIAVALEVPPLSNDAHLLHVVLEGPNAKAVWLLAQPMGKTRDGLDRLRLQPRSRVQGAQLYALAELSGPDSTARGGDAPPSVRVYSQAPPPMELHTSDPATMPTVTRTALAAAPMPFDLGATMRDPLIGQVIAGKYKIAEPLGVGAVGVVYHCFHVELERPVAIKKILHPEMRANPAIAARFKAEARAASKLDHPNITRVLDYGVEPDGMLYLVMEYVSGVTLESVLAERGRISLGHAVDVGFQVAGALARAHGAGIVHRDIKPENLMLARGLDEDSNPRDLVKVCDFGVAKMMGTDPSRGLTVGQGLVGSPMYMSPEQARGEEADPRSDIYSLGVTLYEITTGRPPFLGIDVADLIAKHLAETPVPPSHLVAGYDLRLEAIVLRMLAKDRTMRTASARDLRAMLRTLGQTLADTTLQ